MRPGVVIDTGAAQAAPTSSEQCIGESVEQCAYCGSARLEWRKCKLICGDCRQINKSCADL